jgi:L-ascorbate metabolism protein UlaG (beta-lactamase superfamily)
VQITHVGHSGVLLDTGSARLLIDPGAWLGVRERDRAGRRVDHSPARRHLDGEWLPALLRGIRELG